MEQHPCFLYIVQVGMAHCVIVSLWLSQPFLWKNEWNWRHKSWTNEENRWVKGTLWDHASCLEFFKELRWVCCTSTKRCKTWLLKIKDEKLRLWGFFRSYCILYSGHFLWKRLNSERWMILTPTSYQDTNANFRIFLNKQRTHYVPLMARVSKYCW